MLVRFNGGETYRVTTQFGEVDSWHQTPHTGIDLAMGLHSKILSPTNAVVERIVDYGNQNIGKGVILKTEDGEHLIFGHLSDNSVVHVGQQIHQGDLIAFSGSSGRSSGPHLHLGLRDGTTNQFINPNKYLNGGEVNHHIASMPGPVDHALTIQDAIQSQAQMFQDFFQSLKMNLIHCIVSIDYSAILLHLQHFLKMFLG